LEKSGKSRPLKPLGQSKMRTDLALGLALVGPFWQRIEANGHALPFVRVQCVGGRVNAHCSGETGVTVEGDHGVFVLGADFAPAAAGARVGVRRQQPGEL